MEKISTNCLKGVQITDPYTVMEIAKKAGSVYHSKWEKIMPAGFVSNMQFSVVLNMIERGYLFMVLKTSAKKEHWTAKLNQK